MASAFEGAVKTLTNALERTTKEEKKMLIAVPTANGELCMHFGHCETFALYEVDQNEKKIISKKELVPPPHEPGLLPKWLHEEGVGVVIAGGMGQRAQALFTQSGIEVVVGAEPCAPESVVKAYLDGSLQTGDNVCDH